MEIVLYMQKVLEEATNLDMKEASTLLLPMFVVKRLRRGFKETIQKNFED